MPRAWEYPEAGLHVNQGGDVLTPYNPYRTPTLTHTRYNLTFQLQDCREVIAYYLFKAPLSKSFIFMLDQKTVTGSEGGQGWVRVHSLPSTKWQTDKARD